MPEQLSVVGGYHDRRPPGCVSPVLGFFVPPKHEIPRIYPSLGPGFLRVVNVLVVALPVGHPVVFDACRPAYAVGERRAEIINREVIADIAMELR